MIHLALFTGVVLLGVVVVVTRSGEAAPQENLMAGLGLSAVALLAMVIALTQLRQRVPGRPSDRSPAEYWSDARVANAAIVLWGVLEAAGLLGCIAYKVSGSAIPLGVTALAVVVGFVVRPATLEG